MKTQLATKTIKVKTACGTLYVTIGDGVIFFNMGKAGSCSKTYMESLGRVLSVALRYKTSRNDLIRTMKGIQCGQHSDETPSCIHAIANILESEAADDNAK
jgi:hypothetical protein